MRTEAKGEVGGGGVRATNNQYHDSSYQAPYHRQTPSVPNVLDD